MAQVTVEPNRSALMRAAVALAAALTLVSCAPRNEGPALWRIADADSEIWLFGTVHVLPRELAWRSTRVDRAFASAETIVFETDVDADGRAAFDALVRDQGRLPAGESLTARLTQADRERLARVAGRLHMNPAALDQLRPWLAALQVSLAFAQAAGGDPGAGVESVLKPEAEAARKTLRYLELPEDQIRALSTLSAEAEARFFSASLRQIEDEADTIDEIDQAWARGDVQTLGPMLHEQLNEAGPEVRAAIITDRNTRWTEQIAQMLDGEGRVFIAVGAAHLVGDDSVVAQLRARGIAVEGP